MKGRYQFSEDRGFTLVEILVAMALVALFMSGLLAMFVGFTKSYTTENVKADVQQMVRGGVEHMVPYIRMAGFEPLTWAEPAQETLDIIDGNGAGIKVATATQLRFTADRDMNSYIDQYDGSLVDVVNNEERIEYRYQDNTLSRILYNNLATSQPIVSNVESFSFAYLDEANLPISTPVASANLANIRTVIITMTVREPAGRGEFISRTYENRVRCRNLK